MNTGQLGTKKRRTVLAAGAAVTLTLSKSRAKTALVSLNGSMSQAAGPAESKPIWQFIRFLWVGSVVFLNCFFDTSRKIPCL